MLALKIITTVFISINLLIFLIALVQEFTKEKTKGFGAYIFMLLGSILALITTWI